MKIYNNIGLLIFFIVLSQGAHASGQRTTIVTEVAIASYKTLKLDKEAAEGTVLHYIGSVGESGHLLMVTKTAYPKKVEIKPGVFKTRGMPWDHVFKYFVSTDEMTIINGWDISERMKNEVFEVRHSYCPRIVIKPGQKKYHINPDSETKAACMNMRRFRRRSE